MLLSAATKTIWSAKSVRLDAFVSLKDLETSLRQLLVPMDLCVSRGLEPEDQFCAQKGITVRNKQQEKACTLVNVKADSFVVKAQVCRQRREITARKPTTVLLEAAFTTMC